MSEKKRRFGPAPLPADQQRGHRLSVYVTEAERAELERRAERSGMRTPAYLRESGLNRLPPTIPEVNREAWSALARSAANLNQIARSLNAGDSLQAKQIRAALLEFRRDLIGAKGEENESEG